jgi:hypothetical protein
MYWKKLVELFKDKLTPAWGDAAVRRLFSKTLPKILEEDGAYASKEFR